jgi:peptidoglycan/xylan/chitin deacetylase (PgdA/CDA1 family)
MKQRIKAILKAMIVYGGPLSLYRRWRRLKRGACVSILCCHRVLPDDIINDPENRQTLIGHISASTFKRSLALLKKRYTFIPIESAVQMLKSGRVEHDCMVLTFDDGFYDNYEIVVPILQSLQIPATMYLATSVIGQPRTLWFNEGIARLWQTRGAAVTVKSLGKSYPLGPPVERIRTAYRFLADVKAGAPPERWHEVLSEVGDDYLMEPIDRAVSWEEAEAFAREPLVTVGGHTVHHYILSRCSPELARSELDQCRRTLSAKLGVEVEHFAYPRGHDEDFGDEHVEMLQELGYRSAVTTSFGVNHAGADIYRLKRVGLSQSLCASTPELLLRAAGASLDNLRASLGAGH